MATRPRTIQIYLPNGDPRGIRVAELTTSIVRVVEVPRSLLQEFQQMPEASQVALYLLFGDDESEDAMLYIGQSGNVGDRLNTHNVKKDFWNKALVVISLTNNLTQTHALYLEWLSIKMANDVARYSLENGTGGSKPHTPAPLQADCEEIFDTARTLIATLGFPVFEPVAVKSDVTAPVDYFYCKSGGADGIGEYTPEGFVVLKGSKGRLTAVASCGVNNEARRNHLIASGVMKEDGGMLIFTKDHAFSSPSSAAMTLLGRTANGWLEWKNLDGKTLDEVKRKTI
ncbi:methionine sulfoxide reductase A [Burkholderia cenocepacia]|nr:methionine sulfoxide reductase A [Burkholderia cenocepacia]